MSLTDVYLVRCQDIGQVAKGIHEELAGLAGSTRGCHGIDNGAGGPGTSMAFHGDDLARSLIRFRRSSASAKSISAVPVAST